MNDSEIKSALLSKITPQLRKVSFVVGFAMLEFPLDVRQGINDMHFATVLASLADDGQIEFSDDPLNFRTCEVRVKPEAD